MVHYEPIYIKCGWRAPSHLKHALASVWWTVLGGRCTLHAPMTHLKNLQKSLHLVPQGVRGTALRPQLVTGANRDVRRSGRNAEKHNRKVVDGRSQGRAKDERQPRRIVPEQIHRNAKFHRCVFTCFTLFTLISLWTLSSPFSRIPCSPCQYSMGLVNAVKYDQVNDW